MSPPPSTDRPRSRRDVSIALGVGLALVALALALTLTGAPMSVARTTAPAGAQPEAIASTEHAKSYCQGGETLPRGVSAIRVWLDAAAGPRVTLAASAGGRTLARGERGSGWSGGAVTIPVKPRSRSVAGVTLCVSFQLHDEAVIAQGTPALGSQATVGSLGGGRMWIEYLRPGERSWASLIPAVVRRLGFGRAEPGAWVAWVVLGLMAGIATLATRALVRELR